MKSDLLALVMRWVRWLGRFSRPLCSVAFVMHAWAGVFCSQLLGLWIRKLHVLSYHGRASSLSLLTANTILPDILTLQGIVSSGFLLLMTLYIVSINAEDRNAFHSRFGSIDWQHRRPSRRLIMIFRFRQS